MSNTNPTAGTAPPQATVVIERTYRAQIEDLWALWTTKAGFESWWGPEGFRVEVHVLQAREGGALEYDMIADAPEAIAAMKGMGQPLSRRTRGNLRRVPSARAVEAGSPDRLRPQLATLREPDRGELQRRR